ncbi:ABC transporter substrate-binding protein [Parafannyhessea umbonata]|uniref:ABC transporter substrate-binding protein n=1 Tax=Parafannyhessea umbonata TaxID=604330 RepID=UPI0026EF956A|nr:ABC transporter substrate-binding protein [Parafannyhessea umbonata]MDD7198609.1 ABC transporter substrate-binding protein [Parafannyhessea umbonata]
MQNKIQNVTETATDHGMSRRQFVNLCGLGIAGMGTISLPAGCGGSPKSGTDSSGSASSASSKGAKEYILAKKGTLIGVSDMSYPPLESIPDGGTKPEGFEIDMMDALAKKLGLTMEWLPATKFDTIIPLIKQGGKADVGVSAFTITDDRKKEIDFTKPYLNSNQGLVNRKADGKVSEDALNTKDKQVAVQSGTTGESWVKENLPKATCVPLDDAIQAMTGVQSGLYNAAVLDLPVASYLCTKSYTDLQVDLQIATGEQYGIVVSKKNVKLRKDLDAAIKALKDDGTMDTLQKKWFGTTL